MKARLAVIGTGYVGLVTGACLADVGHRVTCNDVDPNRIEQLRSGRVPFWEPGLADIVARTAKDGRLAFTTSTADAVAQADVAIIAVGTPSRPDGAADLTYLFNAADDVAQHAPKGLTIVIRSTVPPGTGDELARRLAGKRPDLGVVNAPEFLAEGTAVKDFQSPDRLVFGGPPEAARKVAGLWDGVRPDAKRHLVDRPTAELAKYAANTFLAARVSLINEVANLCDAVGADVRAISTIVGDDSRIGSKFLRPGIGYGGSCFPKDVQAISVVARRAGLVLPVAEATEATNNAQWTVVLAKAKRALGDPRGKTVAILGIAFKPETDDTRYAPGLKLARALAEAGASVRMHDPVAKLPKDLASLGVVHASDVAQAMDGADLVVVSTEWRHYAELDWAGLAKTVRVPQLIDGRNALPWPRLAEAGWRVEGIGARPLSQVPA